jgi:hypothetical protein
VTQSEDHIELKPMPLPPELPADEYGPGNSPPEFDSPATDTGRVDFSELLKTDAQWALKERLHASLGRPYLAVQLAQLLPADVCLRLADRVDQLVGPEVERRVAARLEAIHYEVNEQTTATLAKLRQDAEQKARELSDERFSNPSRLD